jgi:hypothetical protein
MNKVVEFQKTLFDDLNDHYADLLDNLMNTKCRVEDINEVGTIIGERLFYVNYKMNKFINEIEKLNEELVNNNVVRDQKALQKLKEADRKKKEFINSILT